MKLKKAKAPSGPVKITLQKPIVWLGETVKELVLQPPEGKHIRDLPAGDLKIGDFMNLGMRLAGFPPSMANKLSGEDTMEVVEVAANFIAGGRATGKKRSAKSPTSTPSTAGSPESST